MQNLGVLKQLQEALALPQFQHKEWENKLGSLPTLRGDSKSQVEQDAVKDPKGSKRTKPTETKSSYYSRARSRDARHPPPPTFHRWSESLHIIPCLLVPGSKPRLSRCLKMSCHWCTKAGSRTLAGPAQQWVILHQLISTTSKKHQGLCGFYPRPRGRALGLDN